MLFMTASPSRPQGVRHFARKVPWIVGTSIFFNNFICSLDDEEVVAAALVVNDHISRQQPRFRGSIPGHALALNHNRESGHTLLYADYFENTALFKPHQISSPLLNETCVESYSGGSGRI